VETAEIGDNTETLSDLLRRIRERLADPDCPHRNELSQMEERLSLALAKAAQGKLLGLFPTSKHLQVGAFCALIVQVGIIAPF